MEMLMEMGFEASTCQTALELTAGNTEAALNYLLTGELPADPSGGHHHQQQQQQTTPSTQQGSFGHGCQLVQCSVSQYSFEGGRSACTAVALEAARTLLCDQTGGGLGGGGDVGTALSEVVRRGVDIYCGLSLGGGVEHTSCDEVLPLVPDFNSCLRCVGGAGVVLQALTTDPNCYASLVTQARALPGVDPSLPLALVITKPPETVLLIAPPAAGVPPGLSSSQASSPPHPPAPESQHHQQQQPGPAVASAGLWTLVDSHSRPHLTGSEGAFILSAPDLTTLVERGLREVFPPVDMGGGDMAMMEAMYNAIEATPIQLLHPPRSGTAEPEPPKAELLSPASAAP